MSEEPKMYRHDRDFAVLTVEIKHISEGMSRIEKVIYDLKRDINNELKELDTKIEKIDEKYAKEIDGIKTKQVEDEKTNSNFRTKVIAYATVGSVAGGIIVQAIFLIVNKYL